MDSCENGKLIPTCHLLVRWIRKESPVNLEYKVNLCGAKKPNTYFYIHNPTVGGKSEISGSCVSCLYDALPVFAGHVLCILCMCKSLFADPQMIMFCLSPSGRASASEAGGESPESKTIRTNLTKITGILSSAIRPMWFAQKLEEEALMDDATSRVVLGVTDPDNVSLLMNAVKAQIKEAQRPVEAFTKFIRILQSQPALMDLLQRLLEEYGELFQNIKFGLCIFMIHLVTLPTTS